jgi:DNA-binding NarL/FixJ family response regulator
MAALRLQPDAVEPSSDRVRTIVCDRYAAFRRGIAAYLPPQFAVVGEIQTQAELERALPLEGIDVAVIDSSLLPDPAGVLRLVAPTVRVIVLAEALTPNGVVRALRAGARGYLLRSVRGDDLVNAMETVMRGENAVDPAIAELVAAKAAAIAERRARTIHANGRELQLSKREYEVAVRLAQRTSTRAIAEELGISLVTVRRYTSMVADKLGVRDRNEAISILTP